MHFSFSQESAHLAALLKASPATLYAAPDLENDYRRKSSAIKNKGCLLRSSPFDLPPRQPSYFGCYRWLPRAFTGRQKTAPFSANRGASPDGSGRWEQAASSLLPKDNAHLGCCAALFMMSCLSLSYSSFVIEPFLYALSRSCS